MIKILEGAISLIEKGWSQHCPVRDVNGNELFGHPNYVVFSRQAAAWCLVSAIRASAGHKDPGVEHAQALDLVWALVSPYKLPGDFNDADGQNKEAVIRLLRTAIALAEKRLKAPNGIEPYETWSQRLRRHLDEKMEGKP